MADEKTGNAGGNRALQFVLLFAMLILLPGMQGAFFGWLYFLVPTAVLFSMYRWQHGFQLVLAGLAIATVISALIGTWGTIVLAGMLIPTGYMLARSALQHDGPALSGLKGSLALLFCCLLLIAGQTVFSGINPINAFLGSLDQDIEAALASYRQSESFAPDTMALLEQSFFQMKTVLPKVLPSLFFSMALFISWLAMLTGNRLIRRLTGYQPWVEHTNWQLPDRLVWLFIGAALLSLLPFGPTRLIGINLLIGLSLIYVLQGFSILSFFLHKWRTPLLLRFFVYGMMLFQSFGAMLLLAVGLADVWFNMRRLSNSDLPPPDHHDDPNTNKNA
ncbi:MAG: DUF2232 domain-containing protein [Desulfofustis sp.]|nr:DUF2232 domain-containing protein [Desulfofustis sp.]